MIIDFHTHYYPKKFIREIRKNGHLYDLEIRKNGVGREVIAFKGKAINTLTEEMNNIPRRMEDMQKWGIDKQVLSMSLPGVDLFRSEEGKFLASMINEEIIALKNKFPEQFLGLATVPLKSIDFAIKELRRAMQNGLIGVVLGSNVNGTLLDDERFYPFLEEAQRLRAIVFLHSATPINKKGMEDYRLIPMYGFMMDVSLCLIRLVMKGILEKLPNLKIIVGQLGGTIPFLLGRIEKCFDAYPECRYDIKVSPLIFLKKIYLDTVSFDSAALECARKSWGGRKLIFGSDYPQVIGDVKRAIQSLESVGMPVDEKELVYSKNLLDLITS